MVDCGPARQARHGLDGRRRLGNECAADLLQRHNHAASDQQRGDAGDRPDRNRHHLLQCRGGGDFNSPIRSAEANRCRRVRYDTRLSLIPPPATSLRVSNCDHVGGGVRGQRRQLRTGQTTRGLSLERLRQIDHAGPVFGSDCRLCNGEQGRDDRHGLRERPCRLSIGDGSGGRRRGRASVESSGATGGRDRHADPNIDVPAVQRTAAFAVAAQHRESKLAGPHTNDQVSAGIFHDETQEAARPIAKTGGSE